MATAGGSTSTLAADAVPGIPAGNPVVGVAGGFGGAAKPDDGVVRHCGHRPSMQEIEAQMHNYNRSLQELKTQLDEDLKASRQGLLGFTADTGSTPAVDGSVSTVRTVQGTVKRHQPGGISKLRLNGEDDKEHISGKERITAIRDNEAGWIYSSRHIYAPVGEHDGKGRIAKLDPNIVRAKVANEVNVSGPASSPPRSIRSGYSTPSVIPPEGRVLANGRRASFERKAVAERPAVHRPVLAGCPRIVAAWASPPVPSASSASPPWNGAASPSVPLSPTVHARGVSPDVAARASTPQPVRSCSVVALPRQAARSPSPMMSRGPSVIASPGPSVVASPGPPLQQRGCGSAAVPPPVPMSGCGGGSLQGSWVAPPQPIGNTMCPQGTAPNGSAWFAPPVGNGSWVPPPVVGGSFDVPPCGSWVPPPPNQGSCAAPPGGFAMVPHTPQAPVAASMATVGGLPGGVSSIHPPGTPAADPNFLRASLMRPNPTQDFAHLPGGGDAAAASPSAATPGPPPPPPPWAPGGPRDPHRGGPSPAASPHMHHRELARGPAMPPQLHTFGQPPQWRCGANGHAMGAPPTPLGPGLLQAGHPLSLSPSSCCSPGTAAPPFAARPLSPVPAAFPQSPMSVPGAPYVLKPFGGYAEGSGPPAIPAPLPSPGASSTPFSAHGSFVPAPCPGPVHLGCGGAHAQFGPGSPAPNPAWAPTMRAHTPEPAWWRAGCNPDMSPLAAHRVIRAPGAPLGKAAFGGNVGGGSAAAVDDVPLRSRSLTAMASRPELDAATAVASLGDQYCEGPGWAPVVSRGQHPARQTSGTTIAAGTEHSPGTGGGASVATLPADVPVLADAPLPPPPPAMVGRSLPPTQTNLVDMPVAGTSPASPGVPDAHQRSRPMVYPESFVDSPDPTWLRAPFGAQHQMATG